MTFLQHFDDIHVLTQSSFSVFVLLLKYFVWLLGNISCVFVLFNFNKLLSVL